MKITICVGSSCYFKGSHRVVDGLKKLIAENHLNDKIELVAIFCMGQCQEGVCVSIDDQVFSLLPDDVENFFENQVKPRL